MRLLMLARYFPPSGGSGVQRLARLARYLPESGVTVDVVTTDLVAEGASLDPDLASELPPEVEVERVPVKASRAIAARVRSLHLGFAYYRGLRWLGVPDPELADVPEMVRAGMRRPRPDAILASSPPFSNLIAGWAAASHFGVPWIVDLRDPWSYHPWFKAMTSVHREAMKRLEAEVLGRAARILIVCEEMQELVPPSVRERTVVIENGFDPADLPFFDEASGRFPAGSGPGSQAGSERPFRLVFVGTLQRAIRLDALETLPPGFELEVVGRTLTPPPASARARGYVSHHEALRAMAGADALVLALPPELSFAPASKLYEYLIAGPPVLALVPPDGAAARLIRRVRGGIVVDPKDARAVRDALEALRRNEVELSSVEERREMLRENRRDVQAQRLSALLDEVISESKHPKRGP